MKMQKVLVPLAGVAAMLVLGASGPAVAQTKTAQSIMIDTSGMPTTLAIVNTEKWAYNPAVAEQFFSNALDEDTPPSIETVTRVLNPPTTSQVPTALEDQTDCTPPSPAAPMAPPALASKLLNNTHPGKEDVVGKNQCNFLDGKGLSGTTYTQAATSETTTCTYSTYKKKGPSYTKTTYTKTRTDTYTYTYEIASLQPSYAAFTAWDHTGDTNSDGTVHVDVTALIAGQSVSVSKNLGTKYSFSLLESDGITPRVSNVCVAVDGGSEDCTGTLTYMDRNPTGPTPDFDYSYSANALLCNGTACSSLKNDDTALNILNGDSFPGNNNGGADGRALAAMVLSDLGVDLGPGSHTLMFLATVKNNDGTLFSDVYVDQDVHIVTPGCGGGN